MADDALWDVGTELSQWLLAASGQSLDVVQDAPHGSRKIILLLDPDLGIARDGFVRASPSQDEIIISAATVQAVGHGVYDLLERDIGVRWLFPGPDDLGTYLPRLSELRLSREERVEEPAYLDRQFSAGDVSEDWLPWAAHMRMMSYEATFHHNLYNLFPPVEYRLSRPEFYPVTGGVRYPLLEWLGTGATAEYHSWQPVMSAEGITDEAVANIQDYFSTWPGVTWYSLGINDTTNWGDNQLHGKPPNSFGYVNMSNDYFPWVGEIASRVLETWPDSMFGLLAYHNVADPPSEPIHSSIVPYLTYDRMQWMDSKRRAQDQARTADWEEKASELGWYDYVYGDQLYQGYPIYMVPRIYNHLMAEYLAYGRDHGVKHYYAEAYPSTQYWTEGPKLYVLAKLLWDPDLDVDELVDDWCMAAVGEAAAPHLEEYYSFWEDYWQERAVDSYWFTGNSAEYLYWAEYSYMNYLTVDDLELLDGLMAKVDKETRGGDHEARADFITAGWEWVRGWAFDERWELAQGENADGFDLLLYDGLEGAAGEQPEGWAFWSRSGVGSEVPTNGFDTDTYAAGSSSYHLALVPDGSSEAYAALYRYLPMGDYSEICARAAALSSNNSYGIDLVITGNTSAWSNWSFAPTDGDWETIAVCLDSSGVESPTQVGVFLYLQGVENTRLDAWYDEVEVFGR